MKRYFLLEPKFGTFPSLAKLYLKPTVNPSHLRFCAPFHNSIEKSIIPILSLIDSCSSSVHLKKVHNNLLVHGQTRNILVQTKLLTSYGLSFKDTEHARIMFNEIPNPDIYSYKAMLKCYIVNESYIETILFYIHMRNAMVEYDNVVISLVLKACINLSKLNEGMNLHCTVIKVGKPDIFLLNIFIDMYAKCGDLESGLRIFDEITDKNVVSWTSIITGYNQNELPNDAIGAFNKMRLSTVEPNEHTMGCLLTSCAMLELSHQGKWVHGLVLKMGMHMNSFISTTMLDMYIKCEEVKDARRFFDGLENIDLLLWTSMIVGYTQNGCPYEGLKLFVDKKWVDFVPNSVTISSVISASGKSGVLDIGRSIHALVLKLGLEVADSVQNSLVDMYAKCCAISEAEHVFQSMAHKETVTYNAMIYGYAQNTLEFKALELFNQMRLFGSSCLPDAVTLVGVFSACSSLGNVFIGSSFHSYAIKCNSLSNVYATTTLINLYNKLGDSNSARKVFDGSINKNIVTWCAMMNGYSMQGDPDGCIEIFGKMRTEVIKPNHVAFTNILTACSHAGIVAEGKNFFKSMTQKHKIEPSIKHYICMIDMLARAGKLDEALEFIAGMTVYKEDARTWASLLNGCIVHSQMEIGKVCVKKMLEIDPQTPDYYVMMSNFYALDGRWDSVNDIRDLMKSKGLMKCQGSSLSWINKDSNKHRTVAEEILRIGNGNGSSNNKARVFKYKELVEATGNFRSENLIGEGGFGRVYKGHLKDTKQDVAVKQLDKNGLQGNREFLVEVLMLSLLHHEHLVNLIGYCADGSNKLLVYEFMQNGSLEDHLLDLPKGKKPLDWDTRMKIAVGAAKGLEYLHDTANPPVIYRDFKASNILLDQNFKSKLSDFGLAKIGPSGGKQHVSTRVMGTYGYCAPEYALTGQLTTMSDVYSFGVVFLEIITGRRAIDSSRPSSEQQLVQWAEPRFKDKKRFIEMADPLLEGNFPTKGLYQALAVAAMCLQEEGSTRPLISDVVTALEYLSVPKKDNVEPIERLNRPDALAEKDEGCRDAGS